MRLHIWVVRTFSIRYCFKKLVFAVPFSKHLTALSHNKFLDALASLKTMFKIKLAMFSRLQDFKNITESYSVLQSITEYYRVLQSITENYRV